MLVWCISRHGMLHVQRITNWNATTWCTEGPPAGSGVPGISLAIQQMFLLPVNLDALHRTRISTSLVPTITRTVLASILRRPQPSACIRAEGCSWCVPMLIMKVRVQACKHPRGSTCILSRCQYLKNTLSGLEDSIGIPS